MSSILNSQGVVLATAMAVSGTVILLALRLQKSFPAAQFQSSSPQLPRSCISSDGKKREKKKKRVQFAEDVVDPVGNSDEFRRQHNNATATATNSDGLYSNSSSKEEERERKREVRGMPANRAALYNGILRDRLVHHRLAYSY
ncbi:hypothetical protein RHSIM_Rhsim01G0069000 [Rhododendron simsii]|uniref:Uncharacterized protein n=1 Tax=Rhododendron simsii TaxID=118357 RepID=A0A834LX16_RHOSS|nr:hypothetical protein RHSIM_Rhsim01G0069000 [Rhododendron simsii]